MSEQEYSFLADCQQYRELSELQAQEADLNAGLAADDFATDSIKTAYEAALQEVSGQAADLAANPELQQKVLSAGAQAVKVLEQLGPLRGILSAEEIADMEAGARGDASSVADYYRRYGANTEEARELLASLAKVGNFAVAGATAVAPRMPRPTPRPSSHPQPPEPVSAASEPRPPAPSPEKNQAKPKEITLIFNDDGVRVGNKGKVNPYVIKAPAEFRSRLTHARRSMLFHMAKHPGQMFSSPELWEVAFGSESEYDKGSMTTIRDWFHKLTHRREPLLASTGGSMGYRIGISPSFHTKVVEADKKTEGAPTAKPEERELGGVRLSSLYVAVQRLISHNHVLEGHGMPAVSQELKESLDAYRPDMSEFITDADKIAYRDGCVHEVQYVFNSNKLFVQFLESLGEENTLMGLAEYFIELLDQPKQRKFVSRLMMARLQNKGVAGQDGGIDGLESELVDEDGVVLWPIKTEAENAGEATPTAAREEPASSSSRRRRRDRRLPPVETELPSESEAKADQNGNGADESQDQPAKGEFRRIVNDQEVWAHDERANGDKRAKIQELEDYVYDLSVKFFKNFDPTKSYSRPQLQSVFTEFTPRMGVDARENKVGPKERHNPVYSLDDMLHVLIYSHSQFQPLSAHKRKATQNLVKRVVNQGIKRAQVEVGAITTAA